MPEVTVREAAAVLGVSQRTIQNRIAVGQMRARKLNPRLYLIEPRELERWKELGRLKSGPKPKAKPASGERRPRGRPRKLDAQATREGRNE